MKSTKRRKPSACSQSTLERILHLDLNLWTSTRQRPNIPFKGLYKNIMHLSSTDHPSKCSCTLWIATICHLRTVYKQLSRLIKNSLDSLCITSSIHQTLFETLFQFLAVEILANERQLANALFIWLPVPLRWTSESHVNCLEDKFLLHALYR